MRTIAQIEAEIDAVIATKTALSGLTSVSSTAIYKLFRTVFAVAAYTLELLWFQHQTKIETIIKEAKPGTAPWLAAQIKLWQYGDSLILDNESLTYSYAEIDEAARIATRVAVNDPGGIVQIKVAKAAGALSSPEKAALLSYLNDIRVPGQQFAIISQAADQLRMHIDIYYKATIPVSELDALVQPVILAYLEERPFNGEFKINAMVDELQKITKLNDVVVRECFNTPLSMSDRSIDRVDIPESGWYEIAGFSLSNVPHATLTTLNYIPV